jgi:hypothetical protein
MSYLCSREKDFAWALSAAGQRYGPADFVSEPLPFDFTDYYEREMGRGLWRRMVGFGPLIMPDQLIPVKLWANHQEGQALNEEGGRRVNIDPGYLAASKFILATGKDYSHRIYLGGGIYGDLGLIFQRRSFSPLPWTYPDYASEPLLGILNLLRKRYLWQLKKLGEEGKGTRNEERGTRFEDRGTKSKEQD